MSKTYTLELDWAGDSDPVAQAQEIASAHGVTAETADSHGPGGGWPIIAFTGEWANLVALLHEYDPDLSPAELIR